MSKSRLGKGLDALLSASTNPVVPPTTPSTKPPTTTASTPSEGDADLGQVAIDQITPNPYQPRRHFDEQALQDLAASIKGQGLLQPLVVRSKAQGGFELIAGERR